MKECAEDELAFFVARVFHVPRLVSSHLQLRLVWEHIVGRSGPQFSSGNLSLRALMADVLGFDQKRLLAHLSNPDIPFRIFTRLMLGIALDAFFEDEEALSRDPLPSLGNEPFFHHTSSKLCLQMCHIKDVLRLVLFCPGLGAEKTKELLSSIDVQNVFLSTLMTYDAL